MLPARAVGVDTNLTLRATFCRRTVPRLGASLPRCHAASLTHCLTATLPLLLAVGCATTDGGAAWKGKIDTLPSGTIVVTNPATGIWDSASAWRVVEELRIGTLEGTGPDLFGEVNALEVDQAGRIYVLEGQAKELRLFDRNGDHVRTVGRQGGGPGEFNSPIGLGWGPDGNLWVIDPQNNRISVIDTGGTFVGSHYTLGGFIISPWPGGFDTDGVLYNYAPDRSQEGFAVLLVRYNAAVRPIDTVRPPRDPTPQEFFDLKTQGGFMRAGIPFRPTLEWHLTRAGDFWAALTGPYELFRLSPSGDTLRKLTRDFEPIPVTGADVDSAIAGLEWFTKQGGKVDRSRFPSVKPGVRRFLVADDGCLWVEPTTRRLADRGLVFDIFDPEGRYLGQMRLPFRLSSYPPPVIRGGMVYAVTEDELEVPFVVRARIVRP